jgi:hypothetical protein
MLPSIIKKAQKKKLHILEPTIDEYNSVIKVIKSFIKNKKRIIYGGYATNVLIKQKNKKDAIYDEELDTPDIEFYTPEPVDDLIELCNLLDDKKFKRVEGRSAQHQETYSIFVNWENCCDLSYMPKIVFNNMETVKIDGLLYVHPKYEIINWYRQFTDPMTAHWRWDKQFPRFRVMQKNYPYSDKSGLINIKVDMDHKIALKEVLDKFISKKDSLILFNYLAYNYLIEVSGYKGNDIKPVEIPYLDIISYNYLDDGSELFSFLKKLHGDSIQMEEYYPFFQYYGYSAKYLYKGKEFINLYHYNYKCTPYRTIKNGPYKNIKICSVPYLLMMLLILQDRTKIDKLNKTTENYVKMFSK